MRTGVAERDWASSPRITSMVETIGRALRGTFVRGMMAMKIERRTERVRG